MNRRQYLTSLTGIVALGLAGCTGQPSDGSNTPRNGSTPSPSPPPTTTPKSGASDTLAAGTYTLRLSQPRVRASVRKAGVHLDVHAEPNTQFLVVSAETDDASLDDLSVSLVANGETVAHQASIVGRPDSKHTAPIAFPIPVTSYASAAVVLVADGESDRWPVPDDIVTAIGTAPDFRVESMDVPESVRHGESFQASFSVSNRGDRDARFLAEFGHALISDTGEVELTVPAGESRTHTQVIDPYYEADPDTVPVVLDWGLNRRRAKVAVEKRQSTTTTST